MFKENKYEISFLLLFFLATLTAPVVLGGSCFPTPTKQYILYINTARVIVLLLCMLIVFVFNSFLIDLILNNFQNSKRKLMLRKFTLFVTLLSFLLYAAAYFIVLPNAALQGLGGGEPLLLVDILILLKTIFLSFLTIVLFFLSFLSVYLMFKFYLKIKEKRVIRTLLISFLMLPFFGLSLAWILSQFFYFLFPFTRLAWIPCY